LTLRIEEGRAASKSPHYEFGYFLSISQQGVSADITQYHSKFSFWNKDNKQLGA
jgi:hypothetical protein